MSGTSLAIIASRTGALVLPDTDKVWTNRLQVPGSTGRLYTVSMRRTDKVWGCSCPGWATHRHCKHLKPMLPILLATFAGSKEAAPIARIRDR